MTESAIIYGFHAISSRLRSSPGTVHELYVDSHLNAARARDLIELAQQSGVRVIPAESARIDGLAGTAKHQGVVAKVAAQPQHLHLEDVLETLSEPPLLLVLDGIQDPHNLGACLRTADAFGVHAVVAPKDRAVGLNATVRKVASGAAETVPYVPVTNLARTLRELKDKGVWIVGTAADSDQDLFSAKLDGPLAWVMGGEGTGMRRLTQELCDFTVSIPMLGMVESLNVSVSCGICLFETRRQRAMLQAGKGRAR
jgi:23S rRNA (guanosine2251-2'-O)-methyltransferase